MNQSILSLPCAVTITSSCNNNINRFSSFLIDSQNVISINSSIIHNIEPNDDNFKSILKDKKLVKGRIKCLETNITSDNFIFQVQVSDAFLENKSKVKISSIQLLTFLLKSNLVIEIDCTNNGLDNLRLYKVPVANCLVLKPIHIHHIESTDDKTFDNTPSNDFSILSPPLADIHRQLVSKYVIYNKENDNENLFIILMDNVVLELQCDIYCANNFFLDSSHQIAIIGNESNIIIATDNRLSLHFKPPTFYKGIRVSKYIDTNSNFVWNLLENSQRELLQGYTKISLMDESYDINRRLLLVGSRDNGFEDITLSLAHKFGAFVITMTPLISFGSGYVTSLREAIACCKVIIASSKSPCILLIRDLEAMACIEGKINRNKFDDISKELCDFLQNDLTRRLLVIGCCKDIASIHPSIVAVMETKVYFEFPIMKHKIYIVEQVIQNSIESLSNCSKDDMQGISELLIKYAESISTDSKSLYLLLKSHMTSLLTNRHVLTKITSKKLFFQSIAGLQHVKKTIREMFINPKKFSKLYASFNIPFEIGMLLYGPPGCGKTKIVSEMSKELNYTLFNISITDVVRGEIGKGEKKLIEIFQRSKRYAPSIIFIDEFQAMFTNRDEETKDEVGSSLTATLAACMDDINNWNQYAGSDSLVIIIGATNEPWAIDNSFLRSGRFGHVEYVGLLDLQGRLEYCQYHIFNQLNIPFVDFNNEHIQRILSNLVKLTDGFSGADMMLWIKRIRMKLGSKINTLDVLSILETILTFSISLQQQPSITRHEIERYLQWKT